MSSPDAARTWLFVPGNRPDRFVKAATSGADQVILDLEDAVDGSAKETARNEVSGWLRAGGRAWVRVNAIDTAQWPDDLAALDGSGALGVVVPKAEVNAIEETAGRTPLGLLALVETARGLREVYDIAAHPQVEAVAFGSVDYALDLGATAPAALDHARHALVVAARAAGLPTIIEGVSPEISDPEAVRRDTVHARALGFTGKLCIHPAQVTPVHDGLSPTEDEREWAKRVLAAAAALPPEHAGAFRVGGHMVDRPVLLRAQRIESWRRRDGAA